MYNIDFGQFAKTIIPPVKRGVKHLAWLKAILTPLQTVFDSFFGTFRPDIVSRAKHNGQKIIMESVLNETFSVTAPPYIYIDNTGNNNEPITFFNEREGFEGAFFFNESEAETPTYLVNNSETNTNTNFVVYVPSAVLSSFGSSIIAAEVDRLRPYSTQYTITSY